MIFWEDITPGQTLKTATATVSEDEMFDFARQFDPQPFHLNHQAGNDSIFGQLCASGWHTCALMMRLIVNTLEREGIASIGSPGIAELQWRKPVYVNDTLSALLTFGASRPSKSNPAMGIIQCHVDLKNQHQQTVLVMDATLMISRQSSQKHPHRHTDEHNLPPQQRQSKNHYRHQSGQHRPGSKRYDRLAEHPPGRERNHRQGGGTKADTPFLRSRWFEDIPVGEFHVFGSYTFEEQEIIDFGEKYDPHYFHIDKNAALHSPFNGLIASGWHICAVWMKMMVVYMERFATGVNDGRRHGAGMGLQNLQWIKPVRPGHTLTFTYEIIEKADVVIRDKWGVIRSRNEAFNQQGELVFSFVIDILAERCPSARNKPT